MAEKWLIIRQFNELEEETSEPYVSKDSSERIPVSQVDPLTMAEVPAEKKNVLGSTISVMYFFKWKVSQLSNDCVIKMKIDFYFELAC